MGKRGRGGKGSSAGFRQQQGQEAPVAESTRIRVAKILENFRVSSDEVYTFDSGVSKSDRAAIHQMCRKMGLLSKSTGKKTNRRLSVFKSKGSRKQKGVDVGDRKQKQKQTLEFTEGTKSILQDLFTRYPPEVMDLANPKRNKDHIRDSVRGLSRENCFCKPILSKTEIKKKVDMLARLVNEDPKLKQVAEERGKLPIASFRDDITTALDSHQVVLISGQTGCGKTTQVPQYILDCWWGKGESCKIICTQPRRISAMSVAERISYERGEVVGNTIGYKIRLESKGGKQSSIMFCTNGVLLRMLVGRGAGLPKPEAEKPTKDQLLEITHIIVDEIHERDRFSDFILAILRDLLPSYPHLKLLLMSATMDAERFSNYFNSCPIISVPGFTYPVKSFYLEDVLSLLHSSESDDVGTSSFEEPEECTMLDEDYKASLDESIDLALSSDEIEPLLELVLSNLTPSICNYQHSSTGVSPLMVLTRKGRVGEVCMLLSSGASCSLEANDGSTVLEWAKKENQSEIVEIIQEHMKKNQSKDTANQELIDRYLETINPESIDTVLIERLLRRICLHSNDGAILVFLPGWEDINQTKERLLSAPLFRNSSRFVILPLHSMIPSSEQKKVFKRPPPNVRKIILSTNIAETAVTIDDVVYVIDSGRMKEKNYDPYNNVSTLFCSWISKANAKQREGRAGRCQPGVCYHLYSKIRAASLLDYQVPEIKRMPIEELCLQVKLLDRNGKIADFLMKTLDPPVLQSVSNAITILQNIGALTCDESLTDLGEKLGALPVHPSTSKMLLFAILMNCLDPALTLACAVEYRDPFVLPMALGERKKAAEAKAELASLYGGYSDHLTTLAAFDCWLHAKEIGQERQFCTRYFISAGTMHMLLGMRHQLRNELIKFGFIPQDPSNCSQNSQDLGILRAVLAAGAYPLVGRLLPPQNKHKRAFVETSVGAKVALNSRAINLKPSSDLVECLLLIYDEITRGEGRAYIKSCSAISPFSLLLLATEMFVTPSITDDEESDIDDDSSDNDDDEMNGPSSKGQDIMSFPENSVCLVLDGWLTFDTTALYAAQIYCLRERLSAAILFKVQQPREVLPPALGASMQSIALMLSSEGMSGICPPLDPIRPVISFPICQIAEGTLCQNSGGFSKMSGSEKRNQMPPQKKSSFRGRKNTNIGNSRGPNPKTLKHYADSEKVVPRSSSFKRRRGNT